MLLIVAGNETTRNATSGGLLALMDNRGELEKLRGDPSLVPSAVEEIVRWVTPVIQFCRTPLIDVEYPRDDDPPGRSVLHLLPVRQP